MTFAPSHTLYDRQAARYDRAQGRWLRYAGGEAQCAFEGAATALLRPGMQVLDVACGTGTVARRLRAGARGAFELTLLDASAKMLAQCRDIPARRVKGCMTALPCNNNSVDLLTCAWGIETLPDPRPALAEFLRVTRRGGHVCLVFCSDRPGRSLMDRVLRRHVALRGLGRFLDLEGLARQALRSGAGDVQVLHCTGPAAAMIVHV